MSEYITVTVTEVAENITVKVQEGLTALDVQAIIGNYHKAGATTNVRTKGSQAVMFDLAFPTGSSYEVWAWGEVSANEECEVLVTDTNEVTGFICKIPTNCKIHYIAIRK